MKLLSFIYWLFKVIKTLHRDIEVKALWRTTRPKKMTICQKLSTSVTAISNSVTLNYCQKEDKNVRKEVEYRSQVGRINREIEFNRQQKKIQALKQGQYLFINAWLTHNWDVFVHCFEDIRKKENKERLLISVWY